MGESGQRAYGEFELDVADFRVLEIPLNTDFTSTEKISFRAVVGGSGTAGAFIDQIEVVSAQ